MLPVLRRSAAGLLFALFAVGAAADDHCRVAFDMGSSGIRAGSSAGGATPHVDIDYLAPQWAGHGLEDTFAPTVAALRGLPEQGGFDPACPRVGGGFSAWRLALRRDPAALAGLLARIEAASGTAVLVIPPLQEGAYGYFGARRLLGDLLATSHVLDIGGGSLQIAGERASWGEALGQKVWLRQLCQEIRNSESTPCLLQPLTGEELGIARALADDRLAGIPAALTGPVSMTAISRPVSRGVAPAVQRLAGTADASPLRRADLTAAIERIARLTREETAAVVGSPAAYVSYLLSDMLLVEGLLRATGGEQLQVAELDLTNLPGLLADDRAFAWGRHYGCYLDRLRKQGLAAYASDPASCR